MRTDAWILILCVAVVVFRHPFILVGLVFSTLRLGCTRHCAGYGGMAGLSTLRLTSTRCCCNCLRLRLRGSVAHQSLSQLLRHGRDSHIEQEDESKAFLPVLHISLVVPCGLVDVRPIAILLHHLILEAIVIEPRRELKLEV